ncbi:cyclin [Anaeramoeba flamelloides]|uniref:Cyclin n=1 Tax=Anaeramoeba flamelloides TaxID=1746091 RepID=A0AAV8A4S5_9EUKA|nr:cyclin [Anaeramoeba flamelloides]
MIEHNFIKSNNPVQYQTRKRKYPIIINNKYDDENTNINTKHYRDNKNNKQVKRKSTYKIKYVLQNPNQTLLRVSSVANNGLDFQQRDTYDLISTKIIEFKQLRKKLKYMMNCETRNLPDHNYLEETQLYINQSMRKVLIDWISEIIFSYNYHNNLLYLTLNYVDRFLSIYCIKKEQLQLLGITCFILAIKFDSDVIFTMAMGSEICKNIYSCKEIEICEKQILQALNYRLFIQTPYYYLEIFNSILDLNDHFNSLTNYFLELSLFVTEFCGFCPTVKVISVILACLLILNQNQNKLLLLFQIVKPNRQILDYLTKKLIQSFFHTFENSNYNINKKNSELLKKIKVKIDMNLINKKKLIDTELTNYLKFH